MLLSNVDTFSMQNDKVRYSNQQCKTYHEGQKGLWIHWRDPLSPAVGGQIELKNRHNRVLL